MLTRRLFLIASIGTLAASCATYDVRDTDPIDPAVGYVALKPLFRYGPYLEAEVGLELVRVLPNQQHETTFIPKVPSSSVSLVKLKPGFYYVGSITGRMNWVSRYGWQTSLFEVKPGQLSYPGDWDFRVIIHESATSGTLGHGALRISFTTDEKVRNNAETEMQVRRAYPIIAGQLPFVFTRVDPALYQRKWPAH